MAMARLNRPSLMVYGGTIKPGCWQDKKLDIVSAFQAVVTELVPRSELPTAVSLNSAVGLEDNGTVDIYSPA